MNVGGAALGFGAVVYGAIGAIIGLYLVEDCKKSASAGVYALLLWPTLLLWALGRGAKELFKP